MCLLNQGFITWKAWVSLNRGEMTKIFVTLRYRWRFGFQEMFVISKNWRFFSIHFTETFAVLKNIVCYIKETIKQRFVSSRFYCKKMKTGNALFRNNKIDYLRILKMYIPWDKQDNQQYQQSYQSHLLYSLGWTVYDDTTCARLNIKLLT